MQVILTLSVETLLSVKPLITQVHSSTTTRLEYVNISLYNTTVSGFIANVTVGLIPLNVGFNVTTGNDNATAWNWSFGDGTWQNGTTQNATHIYTFGGIYTVTETASNPFFTDTTTITNYITVYNQTITGFTANTTTGIAPQGVIFNVTVPTDNATMWNWSFGDGNWQNGTTQNATHTYASDGIYTVNETASNAYSTSTTTMTNYITISNIPSTGFTGTQHMVYCTTYCSV